MDSISKLVPCVLLGIVAAGCSLLPTTPVAGTEPLHVATDLLERGRGRSV